LFPSCTLITTTNTNSAESAEQFIGLHERNNRQEIKDLVGVDPVRTEWCAAFVNAVLELDGIPGSESVSENPLLARSFLDWGQAVNPEDIQPGDIVVFPRGSVTWQGHVGFFVGATDKHWIILGGNQNNTVNYQLFNPKRAIGIRRRVE
jgi:uncharacterized protein (TIGR02594 family)